MNNMCDKCGLRYIKDGQSYCHKTQSIIAEQVEKCNFFIAIQFDGKIPYSPEEHLFFLQNEIEAKKMKKMQGLRF